MNPQVKLTHVVAQANVCLDNKREINQNLLRKLLGVQLVCFEHQDEMRFIFYVVFFSARNLLQKVRELKISN